MSDHTSNASAYCSRSLSALGEDYLDLIGAEREIGDQLNSNNSYSWTGVISTAQFGIAGCYQCRLCDDLDDAWAEIDSLHREGVPPWEFIFNAKDHELPDDEKHLD